MQIRVTGHERTVSERVRFKKRNVNSPVCVHGIVAVVVTVCSGKLRRSQSPWRSTACGHSGIGFSG